MQITLNNRPESIDKDSLSVRELLDYKTFTFKLLVIKINGVFVKKDKYETTIISDGDDVMVLHLISGGWNWFRNFGLSNFGFFVSLVSLEEDTDETRLSKPFEDTA